MPVCEVVVAHDVRAPESLTLHAAPPRYYFRRLLSALCLILIDVSAVAASLLVTRELLGTQPRAVSPLGDGAAMLALLVIFAALGLYGLRERRRSRRRIAGAAGLTLVMCVAAHLLAGAWTLTALALIWSLALALSLSLRMLYDFLVRLALGFHPTARRVIFLGSPEAMEAFSESWREHAQAGRRLHAVGLVADRAPEASWQRAHGLRGLGLLEDLEAIVERERPDELVIVDYDVERARMTYIIELCRRRRLSLKLTNLELRFSRTSTCIVEGCGEPVFVAGPRTARGAAWVVKRCLDVAAAAALLVLMTPLFAVVAVAIKLTSRGPVFFADERIGLGQEAFRCLKFRTMRHDARELQAQLEAQNEADGAIFKIRDDPRVTTIGRLLRKTSIDELPQLINVLRGDMSLVGPRPLPLRDNRLMDAMAKRRHVVLPGMTGMWQVAGRSGTSFEDMIALDFAYIDTWSLSLDLKIIAKTFGAVLAPKGAY